MRLLAKGFVCLLISYSTALAQTSTAQISGTVKDETGSAIPGAQSERPRLLRERCEVRLAAPMEITCWPIFRSARIPWK